MNAKAIAVRRDVTFIVSLMGAAGPLAASAGSVSADPLFGQTNLVSDIPGLAKVTDPRLVNAWGVSESSGSPFWISDNGAGLSTLYSVPGSGPPSVTKVPLTVAIPGAVAAAQALILCGARLRGPSGTLETRGKDRTRSRPRLPTPTQARR